MIWKSTADSVIPKIPKGANATDLAVGYWYEHVKQNLRASPWNIDCTSIYELRTTGIDVSMYSLSTEYRICNEQLSKHLYTRLVEGDHNSIIDSLRDTISQNDGVALLDAIYDLLMPCHAAQILTLLSDLGTIRHKNKETMASLHAQLHNVFKRI